MMKMIAALLFVASTVSGSSIIYDTQCMEGERIVHDSDDTKVLVCFRGLFVIMKCPPESKYKAEHKKCVSSYITEDHKISVSLTDPVCVDGHRIPYFGPDSLNLTRYYECRGGLYTQMICPGQKLLGKNTDFRKCVEFLFYIDRPSVPPTRTCPDGDMQPHETDATKARLCLKGHMYVDLECPPGSIYRVDFKKCYSTFVDKENRPGYTLARPVCREKQRIPDMDPPPSPPVTHYQCLGGSYVRMVCPELPPHQRGRGLDTCHPMSENGNIMKTRGYRTRPIAEPPTNKKHK
uniref:Chitin-binding type-2 domain-containing protein n=1 Tax=Cuerna arida TaxID=1464854 RepID=A0A1B6FXY7_9HEMI